MAGRPSEHGDGARVERRRAGIATYRQGLAFRPDDAALHVNLGPVLAATGRGEEALAHVDRAIAIAPNLSLAHELRRELVQEAAPQNRRAVPEAIADATRAPGSSGTRAGVHVGPSPATSRSALPGTLADAPNRCAGMPRRGAHRAPRHNPPECAVKRPSGHAGAPPWRARRSAIRARPARTLGRPRRGAGTHRRASLLARWPARGGSSRESRASVPPVHPDGQGSPVGELGIAQQLTIGRERRLLCGGFGLWPPQSSSRCRRARRLHRTASPSLPNASPSMADTSFSGLLHPSQRPKTPQCPAPGQHTNSAGS